MKIFKVGDSLTAICDNCQSLEHATFSLRDVPFSDGEGLVKNVLVGVCERCDQVSVLPHQSTPVVKRQLEKRRKPVESRLPAHLLDILNVASLEVGASVDFVPHLMRFYVHILANDEKAASRISAFLTSDLAAGKAEKRLSLKGRRICDDVDALKVMASINNTSDLIKSIILKINDDLLVHKRAKPMQQLRIIAAAVA